MEDDKRVERYAVALGVQVHGMHPGEFDAIERVLAVADEEIRRARAEALREYAEVVAKRPTGSPNYWMPHEQRAMVREVMDYADEIDPT